MRARIVAGNWKMNTDRESAGTLAKSIVSGLAEEPVQAELILAPPFTMLECVGNEISSANGISLAAQNCHQEDSGAYTGEISAQMLRSLGVDYVILGHSERRQYFGENDPVIASKIDKVRENGMKVIYCCGEPLDVRESGKYINLIRKQISEALFHLDEAAMKDIVIAYEPVWAIGTGKTASPAQAQEVHAFIRGLIAEQYSQDVAQGICILYGGSCKPANAKELFANPDVDGGLIGGASLKADDFLAIARSY